MAPHPIDGPGQSGEVTPDPCHVPCGGSSMPQRGEGLQPPPPSHHPRCWIRKVKPDPGELILWDCGVVNNIEASTIKTQQYRLLLRIYRQVSPQTRSLRTLLAVLHEVQAS